MVVLVQCTRSVNVFETDFVVSTVFEQESLRISRVKASVLKSKQVGHASWPYDVLNHGITWHLKLILHS